MEPSSHREVAVATSNRCWVLLGQASRTPDDDIELLTSAFVSRYHWTFVGGPEQSICAYWMISRAAAALGEGTPAVAYAERANPPAQEPGIDDWLVASTAEELVRAIADDEDRELIASQLATVPR